MESPSDPNQKWLVIALNNGWSWTYFYLKGQKETPGMESHGASQT